MQTGAWAWETDGTTGRGCWPVQCASTLRRVGCAAAEGWQRDEQPACDILAQRIPLPPTTLTGEQGEVGAAYW